MPQVREFTHRYDVPSERTVSAASVKTRKSEKLSRVSEFRRTPRTPHVSVQNDWN